MSEKTPVKSTPTPEATTSPVFLHQSPIAASPQQNLTGLPRVARDIAADVHNNIQKWNECHIRGAKLLQQIIDVLSDNIKQHPPELEKLIGGLYLVVQQLTTYLKALSFLSMQIQALAKLHQAPQPLFISLSCEELSNLVSDVASAYKNEFKVKEYVLENVAYSATKSEAMFHAACWAHQLNITDGVNLKLEALLTETGHRKIS